MITNKELRIIDLFKKDIFAKYSIREIMNKLKNGSYNWTYIAVQKLHKEGIIVFEQIGNTTLCSINLDSEEALLYLALLEQEEIKKRKIPNVEKLKKLIPTNYNTLIVGGSYAAGTQNLKSDLDVAVIVGKEVDKRPIQNVLKNEGDLMHPRLHSYVFTEDEFFEMLVVKEENYGKEIFRKHILLSGAESFYRIVKGAHSNGFDG